MRQLQGLREEDETAARIKGKRLRQQQVLREEDETAAGIKGRG